MSAHTPGPWKVDENFYEGDDEIQIFGKPTWPCSYSGRKQEWVVAKVGDVFMDEHQDEYVANAHLIAAAPEMLEALKRISRAGTLNDQSVIDEMRAAIARAEGGKP